MINRDVFLSLLALDSYNRGYGANVGGLSESGQIGNASIVTRASIFGEQADVIFQSWQAAGFYAIAYNVSGVDGLSGTVISYRGTNFPTDPFNVDQLLAGYNDVAGGWSIFTGWGTNSHAQLARDFLVSVTGQDFPAGSVTFGIDNLTLTGHSLGGALAGYIGARALAPAVIFDPVPYGGYVNQSVTADALEATLQQLSLTAEQVRPPFTGDTPVSPDELIPDSEHTWEEFYSALATNISHRAPDFGSVSGFSLEGEIAATIEFLQPLVGSVLSAFGVITAGFDSVFGASLFGSGLNLALDGIANASSGDMDNIVTTDARGLNETDLPFDPFPRLDPVSLHSISLETIMLFGERQWAPSTNGGDGRGSSWENAARYVFTEISSDSIAERIGIETDITGIASAGAQMSSMIAYSLIDEGTRVFGDTGIRALFDDTHDLGRVLARLPNVMDEEAAETVGSIVAEFAGLLAFNRIEQNAFAEATNGILQFGEFDSIFRIDISRETWSQYDTQDESRDFQSTTASSLVSSLLDDYIGLRGSPDDEADPTREAFDAWLYSWGSNGRINTPLTRDSDLIDNIVLTFGGSNIGGGSGQNGEFDGYQLLIGDDTNTTNSNEAGYGGSNPIQITGSRAIVVSGNGGNGFIGTEHADAFITGSGADTLIGGDGNDFFSPGRGNNTIYGDNQDRAGNGIDTVHFAELSGSLRISYSEDQLTVNTNNGVSTLFDVEEVVFETGSVLLSVDSTIAEDTQLNIRLGEGGTQLLNNIQSTNGVNITISQSGGYVEDALTGGRIGIYGFNTEIIGSSFDDSIFDGSDEDKVITAGDGSDAVSVGGTGATAVIFGGEGADQITGGDGDDFLIDHGFDQDVLSDATAVEWGDGSRTYSAYGSVDAGAGDDVIIVGRESFVGREFSITTYGRAGSGFYIDAGEGNDTVNLVGGSGVYYYSYDAGDGNDQVFVNSEISIGTLGEQPDGSFAFISRFAASPDVVFDLSDYNSADISVNFSISSVRELDETEFVDANDEIGSYAAELSGTLTISLSDGGSIVFNDYIISVFGSAGFYDQITAATLGDEVDLTSTDFSLGGQTPWRFLTADGGPVVLSANFGPPTGAAPPSQDNPANAIAAARSFADFSLVGADIVAMAENDVPQDAFLSPGEQSFTGGSGNDRLIVTWDLDALTSTLTGDQLVIADIWGLVGTTTLTAFDEIYSVAQDRSYTQAEFHEELMSRRAGDDVTGTEDDDVLVGTDRRDVLEGFGGNDELTGLAGDDTLDGGAGIDVMIGGSGDDIYVVDEALDEVVELADEGRDTVRSSVDHVLAANVENLELLDGGLAGTGNDLSNRITGNDADNILSGAGGDDYLVGGLGDDIVDGGDGHDTLLGGDGTDTLSGGEGRDILRGDSGADVLDGGAGSDSLQGGSGNDELIGGDGNDRLDGGSGTDLMTGGGGDDYYRTDTSSDNITELADGGIDTVEADFSYTLSSNLENLILTGNAQTGEGNAANNTITGNDRGNFLYGYDGDDILSGGAGSDEIEGGDGNDTIAGGAGYDYLFGDDGNDEIDGGLGSDEIEGGAGDDILRGGEHVESDDGDAGGGPGGPNPGDPVFPDGPIVFDQGDYLFGGTGNDTLITEGGDDELLGEDGDDILFAGAGFDYLEGGSGNDLLYGGAGSDDFYDGAGNDLYVGSGYAELSQIGQFVAREAGAGGDEDVVVFEGSRADYSITALDNGWFEVSDIAGVMGTNYLVNIDVIEFETGDDFETLILEAPTATSDDLTVSLVEDNPIIFDIASDWFVDANGQPLTYSIGAVDSALAGAGLTINGNNVVGAILDDLNGTFEIQILATSLTGTASVTVEVDLTPVNDAPITTGTMTDETAAAGTELSFAIDQTVFSDVDGDVLTFTAQLQNSDPLPSWLSFDGQTFTGTPPSDAVGSVALAIIASDGEYSVTNGFTLELGQPVNTAPEVLTPLVDVNLSEDTAIDLALPAGTFTDAEGDMLTLTATLVDGGLLPDWLVFDGARFTSIPPLDFNGSLELLVTASDGEFGVSSALNLTIDPVNDAPALLTPLLDIAGTEDTAFVISLPSGTFADVDGDMLAITATLVDGIGLPAWLAFDGTQFTGTPPQDFNGSLDILVTASDGEFDVSDTLTFVIASVNDAPTLVAALSDANFGEDSVVDLILPEGAFADSDGSSVTLTATLSDGTDLPAWLTFDGERFTGLPPANFNGDILINVTASDGELTVSDQFVLAINSVNDGPAILTPVADIAATEDTQFAVVLPLDGIIDVDGDVLSFSVTQADGGELPNWLVFADGQLQGTPPANFNGMLALQLVASDGNLSIGDPFALTISAVNDAPVVAAILPDISSDEDTGFAFEIPIESFSDVDGDTLSLSAAQADGSDLPSWLGFDGSQLAGTPPADFNGSLQISITASDGELSVSSVFTLSINPVNDAPVLLAALSDQSVNEDNAVSITLPANAFADVDGDTLALTASLANGDALPDWLLFDGATFSGTPPADFNGIIDLRVTASDGQESVATEFRLSVDPLNDAPAVLTPLANQLSDEDTAFSFTIPGDAFADVDGDELSYSATLVDGSDLPAWLNLDGTIFSGTPPQDFFGSLEVSVTASDGTLTASDTFTLDIALVNDAPTVVQDIADIALVGGETFELPLSSDLFDDVDGDQLTLSATLADGSALPDWLVFDGVVLTATTEGGFDEAVEILVTASDGELSASQSFSLVVSSTNVGPEAVDDGVFVTTSNRDVVIDPLTLLENDSDANGDALEIVGLGNATGGQVSFDDDGYIVFVPDAVFEGAAEFTYTVSDGTATSQATVSLQIDPSDQFDTWRQGNDGRNWMFGSLFGQNNIFGAGGNDWIFGGFRSDNLAGGDGDDRLFGSFGNDNLWGGRGDDLLFGGFGLDTAHFYGDRDSYSITTQGGFLSLRISDNDTGADGDDGADRLSSIERLSFRGGETISIAAPIILDLAGDGIETVSATDSDALFDLDGDGIADDTSWIGSGEAFLYLDRNGDGTMTDASEISFIDDVEDAASDLAGLRAFDSNGDGLLTADDERFAEFGIWRDINGDGIVDEGETFSLTEASIMSFDLAGTAVDGTTPFGDVAILNTGSFTLGNGETRGFADAALTYFSAADQQLQLQVLNAQVSGRLMTDDLYEFYGTQSDSPELPSWTRDINNRMHYGFLNHGMLEQIAVAPDDRSFDFLEASTNRHGISVDPSLPPSLAGLIESSSATSPSLSEQSQTLPTQPIVMVESDDNGIADFDDYRWDGEFLIADFFVNPLDGFVEWQSTNDSDAPRHFRDDLEIQIATEVFDTEGYDMVGLQETYSALIDGTARLDAEGNLPPIDSQAPQQPVNETPPERADMLSRDLWVGNYFEPYGLEVQQFQFVEVFA